MEFVSTDEKHGVVPSEINVLVCCDTESIAGSYLTWEDHQAQQITGSWWG